MTPVRVGRKGEFDFRGEASLGRLITGLAGFPHTVASPPGFENLWTVPVVGTTRNLTAA